MVPPMLRSVQGVAHRFRRREDDMNRNHIILCAWFLAAAMGGGCANTVKGVKKDAEHATEKTAAAAETVDVKSALIADGRVDASSVNVDTVASTKNGRPQGVRSDSPAEDDRRSHRPRTGKRLHDRQPVDRGAEITPEGVRAAAGRAYGKHMTQALVHTIAIPRCGTIGE